MCPNTTLRKSPRSPRTPRQEQTVDQSPSPLMTKGSRNNPSVSSKQAMSAQSRAGSMVNTRRFSRVGSRKASAGGGVVGLPGAGDFSLLDEFIGPDMQAANAAFFDEFLNPMVFGSAGADGDNQFGEFDQFLGQDLSKGLDQDTEPANGEPLGQLKEAAPGRPDLVPVVSTAYPPFDPTYAHQASQYPWNAGYSSFAPQLAATPGFTAIHGAVAFAPQEPSMYPEIFSHMHPTGPYMPYFRPGFQQYIGYIPIDPQLRQPQGNTPEQTSKVPHIESYKSGYDGENISVQPKRERSYDDDDITVQPKQKHSYDGENIIVQPKRKRAQSRSDSEDDVPTVKRHRPTQPIKETIPDNSSRSRRRKSVDSGLSESNSLSKPIKVNVVRAGEKPKKCDDKYWVRINNTTKGETTRTARINQSTKEGTKYKVKPLPLGDWETAKFKFEYTHHNGMDEFKKRTMTARQIHEYITHYPGEHLRIWIQVTPADSARRYASKSHSECMFEQCPNRLWANKGTIEVGNYRVAFDEKHKRYGKGVVDPFDCVGYAHLYCMERFLDFEGICQDADVRVDTRDAMPKEPKGVAAFAFSGKHVAEKPIAEKFIKAAKVGGLGRTPEFSKYPVHSDYTKGERKPHELTLIHAMFTVNWDHRTRSQLKQFVYRDIKPSAFGIHRGDQEVLLVDKKVESLDVYKKAREAKQHGNFDKTAYYDQFYPEINIRIAECIVLRTQFEAEDSAGTAPTRGGSKKRKIIAVDDSDNELGFDAPFEEIGDDDYHGQQRGSFALASRRSPRSRQQVNYAEPEDIPQQHNIYNQITQHLPSYEPASQYQGRRFSVSQLNPDQIRRFSATLRSRSSSITNFMTEDLPPFEVPGQPTDTSEFRRLGDDEMTEWIQKNIVNLERRKSSTVSNGPYNSVMKSPAQLRHDSYSSHTIRNYTRNASFNAQPVTSSKVYNINDPPSQVAPFLDATRRRSSARLASKIASSLTKDDTDRNSKRRKIGSE